MIEMPAFCLTNRMYSGIIFFECRNKIIIYGAVAKW